MANENPNTPMGLRPVGTIGSAGYTGRVKTFATSTSDTTAIGIGDAVILTDTGDAAGVQVVSRLTTAGTTMIVGAVVGIVPDPTNLTVGYRAASTATKVLVDCDPNTIFEIQTGTTAATTIIGVAAVGNGCSYATGTVSTTTGNGLSVLGTTLATTAATNLKVLEVSPRVGNIVGDYCKFLVLINNHAYKAGANGL